MLFAYCIPQDAADVADGDADGTFTGRSGQSPPETWCMVYGPFYSPLLFLLVTAMRQMATNVGYCATTGISLLFIWLRTA